MLNGWPRRLYQQRAASGRPSSCPRSGSKPWFLPSNFASHRQTTSLRYHRFCSWYPPEVVSRLLPTYKSVEPAVFKINMYMNHLRPTNTIIRTPGYLSIQQKVAQAFADHTATRSVGEIVVVEVTLGEVSK
jgi:hypothetical protein